MELNAKQAIVTPLAVLIIGTYDEKEIPNAMNAAWGTQSDFSEITIFLGKHKTTENLKKTGAFTVSFATKDTVEISDYFGVETGNHVNKIEKAGCHVHEGRHVHAPVIEEYPVTLECTVKSYSDETGILVGTIVSMEASEEVLTDGNVDTEKLQPIAYDMTDNSYRVLGPVVGHAFKDGMKLK